MGTTAGSRVSQFIPVDARAIDVRSLASQIKALSANSRRALLADAARLLHKDEAREEGVRIAAVRLLLAGLPDSLDNLGKLLAEFDGSLRFEVHFTIFCWMDDVDEHPDLESFRSEIMKLAENYLMNVPKDTGKAAWMAGHFMGGHWAGDSLEALSAAALNARFAAGRIGALAGLADALRTVGEPVRQRILSLFHRIERADRSEEVRGYARLAINLDASRTGSI